MHFFSFGTFEKSWRRKKEQIKVYNHLGQASPSALLFPSALLKKVGEEKRNKQRFMTTWDKPHVVKNDSPKQGEIDRNRQNDILDCFKFYSKNQGQVLVC